MGIDSKLPSLDLTGTQKKFRSPIFPLLSNVSLYSPPYILHIAYPLQKCHNSKILVSSKTTLKVLSSIGIYRKWKIWKCHHSDLIKKKQFRYCNKSESTRSGEYFVVLRSKNGKFWVMPFWRVCDILMDCDGKLHTN